MALAATLLAGAFFLLGALIAWRVHDNGAIEDYSIAVAFGALVCVAAIDLIPEAVEAAEELGWLPVIGLVVGGAVVLVALDRVLPDHHAAGGGEGAAHIGGMAFIAVFIHNLAEGAAIYAIASQDLSSGMLLAVGVGMHNAPLGMLLYAIIKQNRVRGVVILAVVTLSTSAGGLAMFALGNVIDDKVLSGVVCVALGMIAYISFAELLPAMVRGRKLKRSLIGVAAGAAFVLLGSALG